MPSALELYYQRRSRVGRDPSPSSSSSSSDHYRHFDYHSHRLHHHHGRHDPDGCDLHHRTTRSSHLRHRHPRPSSAVEHTSVRLDVDPSPSHIVSNDSNYAESSRSTSRPSLTSNDRLPGTVLLARARLLERLRGTALSESRHSGRSFVDYNREHQFEDELRVVDAGDWGLNNPTGWSSGVLPSVDSTTETERTQFVQGAQKDKPPGLSLEALDLLQSEVYSSLDKGTKGEGGLQVSDDCSICLESFSNGDEIIRLPCEHRFHSTCLEPWVRTCGDCPYCRRVIVISSHKNVKES